MATLDARVTALEVEMSGVLTALGVTPTSRQVAASLAPLRSDITQQGTEVDALDAAVAALQGQVRDLSFSVKQLQPSG